MQSFSSQKDFENYFRKQVKKGKAGTFVDPAQIEVILKDEAERLKQVAYYENKGILNASQKVELNQELTKLGYNEVEIARMTYEIKVAEAIAN